ncbi:MAG: transcriptional antiterminator NusG [Limisphaerales bacterium]|jgi:transcriptional antiterminator NusG
MTDTNNQDTAPVETTEAAEETTEAVEATPAEETTETVEAVPTEETTETVETAPTEETTEAGEEEEERIFAKGDSADFQWFIAKTMTGQESKVQRALKERIVNFKLTELFAEILVPEETVISNAGGKKRTLKKKIYPGYILLKMVMSDHTWHLVKDTDKITGFVGGTSDKPAPLKEEEAAFMTNQAKDGVARQRTSVDFSEGDSVKVIEGPFASFVGTVEHVNDKGKIKVNVSIFGRPTPVELDFSQVEKTS